MDITNKKYLYAVGCSHMAGSEVIEFGNTARTHESIKYAWPGLLAEHYGLHYINDSEPGGSNEYMVRSVMHFVNKLLSQDRDPSELLDYAEEITKFSGRRIDISFLMNNYPKCLDIRNLPKHVRVEGQKRLRDWLNTSKYFKDDERNIATVEGIIKALEDENVNADAEKQMQIFKEYTELLDSKRDQSIKESIPDLWRMLND